MRLIIQFSCYAILFIAVLAGCTESTDNNGGNPSDTTPTALGTGVISFSEVQQQAGIDFTHFNSPRNSLIPEDVGSGVGWADFDNDGDEDLYFVNFAAPFLASDEDMSRASGNRLYRNDGDGHFTDITKTAGVGHVGWDFACLWWDADNDGNLDLTVTHYSGLVHYRNLGDGTFQDTTSSAGFGDINSFLLGLTAGDYDLDGDLDLYLCGYVEFDRERARNRPIVAGRPAVWTNPVSYPALPNILLQNNSGTFTDVTESTGVANPAGKSMQAIFCDFNNDGYPDLFVGNDVGTADAMYLNNQDGTFKDVSKISSTFDRRASMGMAVGDVYHHGKMDLFTTHWVNEDHALWKNQSTIGDSSAILMEDVGPFTGILKIKSTADVAWGVNVVDFDNDGHLDVILANGSTIEDELTTEVLEDPKLLPQKSRILRNDGQVTFVDVSDDAGPFFHKKLIARGLATADYDHDGRLDVAVGIHSGAGVLLHNTSSDTGNWLQIKLEGSSSNRFGIGAKIEIKIGANIYSHQSVLSSSYLSTNSTIAHFGLGNAKQVDSITVTWPSGVVTEQTDATLNQLIIVTEESQK
ncbi:MAG: CRTAC1 family protein [Planctomycetaceae bacterium]|jgi:enediyne biosynthesis protein E4|nr:CRTAC1 family protein [Planctomycetaceae bacterium]